MDETRDYHIKSEREREVPQGITYMWNLNKTQMNRSMKQKHGHREQACGGQGGRVWERGGEGGWGQKM